MVLIGDDIAFLTLDVHLGESLILGECLLLVAHTVTLEVRLGGEIDTVFVAEVVPTWIVGIVAGAHGIDVELLHDADILDHTLDADDIAPIRVEFVTVGTLDEDRLAIDQQLASTDLYVAEAHLLTHDFQHLVALLELEFQHI